MIFYLSLKQETPKRDYWDYGLVEDLLRDLDFTGMETDSLPKVEKAIVLLPARHHAGMEKEVNKELEKIEHVILFLMGDEEAEFDVEAISHPSIHIWVQNPHLKKHDKYNRIGTGYPGHLDECLPENATKEYDLFFSGQITHQRREELADAILRYDPAGSTTVLHRTKGFTQGLEPKKYYEELAKAKIAPAPSGAVIPDSFRLFEAMECMSVVIADQKTADGTIMEYWDWLFGNITPFIKTDNWNNLPSYMNEILEDYPQNIHRQTAWYLLWKRNLKQKILEQWTKT
jgi:hypothetical protein